MLTVVWLLSEILKLLLRLEHKADILIQHHRTKGELPFIPPMSNQTVDPVTGQAVKYVPVQLSDYGIEVMVRESVDSPRTVDLPKSIGG